jgi:hypothetical protein
MALLRVSMNRQVNEYIPPLLLGDLVVGGGGWGGGRRIYERFTC